MIILRPTVKQSVLSVLFADPFQAVCLAHTHIDPPVREGTLEVPGAAAKPFEDPV